LDLRFKSLGHNLTEDILQGGARPWWIPKF